MSCCYVPFLCCNYIYFIVKAYGEPSSPAVDHAHPRPPLRLPHSQERHSPPPSPLPLFCVSNFLVFTLPVSQILWGHAHLYNNNRSSRFLEIIIRLQWVHSRFFCAQLRKYTGRSENSALEKWATIRRYLSFLGFKGPDLGPNSMYLDPHHPPPP